MRPIVYIAAGAAALAIGATMLFSGDADPAQRATDAAPIRQNSPSIAATTRNNPSPTMASSLGRTSSNARTLPTRHTPQRADAPNRFNELTPAERAKRDRDRRNRDRIANNNANASTTGNASRTPPRQRQSADERMRELEARRAELAERRQQRIAEAQRRAAERSRAASQYTRNASQSRESAVADFVNTGPTDANNPSDANKGENNTASNDSNSNSELAAILEGLGLDASALNSGGSDPGSNNAGGGGGGGGDLASIILNGQPSVGNVSAVWFPVPNTNCNDVAGMRTTDLYVRFKNQGGILSMQTGGSNNDGLTISNAQLYQSPTGSDTFTGALSADPCFEYDSFFSLGDATGITAIDTLGNPPKFTSPMEAFWFIASPTGEPAVRDRRKFGDRGYYLRVARFTAPVGAEIEGSMIVLAVANGAIIPETITLTVPNCPECWQDDPNFNNPPAPEEDPDDDAGDPDDDTGDPDDDTGDPDDGTGDPDDGTGDPDDGTDDPDDGGGDPDDGTGDPDDGGGDPDDGGSDPPPAPPTCEEFIQDLQFVWQPVTIDCDELGPSFADNFACNDLYLRFDKPFAVQALLSPVCPGDVYCTDENFENIIPLSIIAGPAFPTGFAQHPNGNAFPIRFPEIIEAFPCLVYDTYLTLGNNSVTIFDATGTPLETIPTDHVWVKDVQGTPSVDAFWFSIELAFAEQDPATFGDDAYYLHIARLTAAFGSQVFGSIDINLGVLPDENGEFINLCDPFLVDIPDQPELWQPAP